MLIYQNLIADSEQKLQTHLNRAIALGWGNPSNPTLTHWEEKVYGNDGTIRGVNNFIHWTQVVSKDDGNA